MIIVYVNKFIRQFKYLNKYTPKINTISKTNHIRIGTCSPMLNKVSK